MEFEAVLDFGVILTGLALGGGLIASAVAKIKNKAKSDFEQEDMKKDINEIGDKMRTLEKQVDENIRNIQENKSDISTTEKMHKILNDNQNKIESKIDMIIEKLIK